MQKWAFFTMGMMTGIIVLLVCALIMQSHENVAYAAQATDNNGKGLLMATGGTSQGQQDILWVLHEHDPIAGLKMELDDDAQKYRKAQRLSLLMYRCENGTKMKLVSARDLAYDEELIDFNTEAPSVREAYEKVKKAVKDSEKKK